MDFKKLLVVPTAAALLATNAGLAQADTHQEEMMVTVDTEAAELRSTLDHLLSEHAFLAVETMRKGADGAEDFEESAAALSENTDELSSTIGSVYGEEAGQQFKTMWSEHIGYFVDYVNATAAGDEGAKETALNELAQYRQDFSQFLETATDERLEAGALADGLQMHVNQLIGAFDAYVMGDYETAYQYEREAIHHMYMVSKGLSTAIADQFPDQFNNTDPATKAADLRSDLNYLFSEHAGLAAMAMQNGIDGAEDFEASAQALSNNTQGLTEAVTGVYGEEAGQQFKAMWAEHIGYFVDYVNATAAEDTAAQEEALNNLNMYKEEFSKFMETATEGNLASGTLAEGLEMHVNQLIGAFDAYSSGDYEVAYDQTREAYHHMFNPSKGLASAIVTQMPDMFMSEMPEEMPNTAMAPEQNNALLISIIAGIALLSAVLFRLRARNQ
ncbi:copper amine oxidase [Salinicoccus sp. ID82-1]|uniref:copper amine oxidase n=1 Tax=Salinicoccus sp. ID82-1 TaxID=2820269 RepID=UPI001F40A957|nr:copper amine oxidase [Salinicoccus sp. ID82-1]MCG1008514.1 copper amine oxidase [Salinicoccus sp. ID82-1]